MSVMDHARLQVAADCLIDNGFDDVAEELQTRAGSMRLAEKIISVIPKSLSSNISYSGGYSEFTGTVYWPKKAVDLGDSLSVVDAMVKQYAEMLGRQIGEQLAAYFAREPEFLLAGLSTTAMATPPTAPRP